MQTIGPYEVLGELGRGGMGVVLRVRHGPTGAIRALKLLEGVPDRESLERFRREGEALARLGGEGVVPVHETGVDGRRLYIVMDLLPAGSLRERLKRAGRLPWTEAALLGAKLAGTLARAHAQGLVHRDLKPDNVLHDDRGEPRLADWGCVRDLAASALTQPGDTLGTPAYMAPEQQRGRDVGPPADVWSLGILLHEAVSGERPYAGSMRELHEAAVSRRRPSLVASGAPPALEALVARALDPEPAGRPTAEAMARELAAVAEGRLAPAGPDRTTFALGGIVAVGVFVGLLVLVLAPMAPGPRPPSSPTPTLASTRAPTPAGSVRPTSDPHAQERALDVGTVARFLGSVEAAPIANSRGSTPAERLDLVRDAREALSAARRLATDELPAETEEAWGARAWATVRLRDRGFDAARDDRVALFLEVLSAAGPRSLWLRAALAALEQRGATDLIASPPSREALRALGERHPVEAAWIHAVVARPASEVQWKEVLDEDARYAAIVEAPEQADDLVAQVARSLFVGHSAARELLLAEWSDRDGALGHLARVRDDLRRARTLPIPGGRTVSLEIIALTLDGAVLGDIADGPITPPDRAEALREIEAIASRPWSDEVRASFELIRDYWHARDSAEPERTAGILAVRQRAIERVALSGSNPADPTGSWFRGIVLGCSLALGDRRTVQGIYSDGRFAGDAVLATGWLWRDSLRRLGLVAPR